MTHQSMDSGLTPSLVKKILLTTWVLCTLGFLILTGLVIKDRLRGGDFAMTVKLQDRLSKRFDSHFVTIVDLGSMEIQTLLIVAALLLAPISKKTKLILAVAYIAGLAVTLLGKSFLPQPAPPFLLQRGTTGISFPSSHVQVDASYPSGHTFRVMFLASLVCGTYLATNRRTFLHLGLSLLSVAFAILVMTGLILLGKHWSSDVIGGIFLASGLVSFCLLLPKLSYIKRSQA